MTQDTGASRSATGLSQAEPEEVSALRASIPSAVTISGELYAFLMGEGPLEGVWFGDLNDGLPGRFWWRGLLRCAAGWPAKDASAIEARRAATENTGAVHESAVAESETPKGEQP